MTDTTRSRHTATFEGITFGVSTPQDAFELVVAAGKRVRIRRAALHQYSDFADAQAEILPVSIVRGYTTSGSGGASVTPVNTKSDGPAASSTIERNNTTLASGGTAEVLAAEGWNVAAGWVWEPTEKESEPEQSWLVAGDRVVIRVGGANDALTVNGSLTFDEEGVM